MTEIEFIEAKAALEQEARENIRANSTQMDIIESRHRDNIAIEEERYYQEIRRQVAEFNTRADDIETRMTEIKMQRAITRAEEGR